MPHCNLFQAKSELTSATTSLDARFTSSSTQNQKHDLQPVLGISFDYHTMPVVNIMEPEVFNKLMEYSTRQPTPISIEEFMAMGAAGAVTEADSYNHLKIEVIEVF